MPLRVSPPLGFYTLTKGIKTLDVPLGSLSFTFFFLQDVLNNDVQHIDALSKVGDVQVAFGIFIRFMQRPYYLCHFFPPLLDFQTPINFLLFDPHSRIWETFKVRFFRVFKSYFNSSTSLSSHLQRWDRSCLCNHFLFKIQTFLNVFLFTGVYSCN